MILAKSNPPETLKEHTESCLSVFSSIRENMPYLPEVAGESSFFRNLFYAVALHDIGKAAPGFQEQITSNKKWGYRHEILSAGFVWLVSDLTQLQAQGVALAIISHHKNISNLRERFSTKLTEGRRMFRNNLDSLNANMTEVSDFLSCFPELAKTYLNEDIPPLHTLDIAGHLEDAYVKAVLPYVVDWEDDEKSVLHGIYGILLRGLLIACDHLSSGGISKIQKGISNIDKKLSYLKPRPFQSRIANNRGNTFLLAPTGSGKTEASLLWTGGNKKFGERVYYVLPYTASINAMSQRMSAIFTKDQVGILHGKSIYFIYQTLLEMNYSTEDALTLAKKSVQLSRKIYRPLKILTPFHLDSR